MRLTRKAKVPLEVLLLLRCRRKPLQPLGDLDHTFLALAVLSARRGNLHANPLGVIKDRPAARCRVGGAAVDGKNGGHQHYNFNVEINSALTASATCCAEPCRSCSAPHFHWAV